ncbi:MAG: ABC transporter permease [Gracilibacteraceae bacterium]|jgi:ABC-2 type transport system permease protein|nr:ABC transporter permease [Gracilibacteraceae bacterium]
MRVFLFASRNAKEVLRDPVNLFFGLGFPLVLLALLSLINASLAPEAGNLAFWIRSLAPGAAMFGSIFMALFAGMVLAKDRASSFLTRLFTSPMTPSDFLLGYTAPMVVMTMAQSAITFSVACFFGLPFSVHIIMAIFMTAITSLLFIGIGLLTGSLTNDKAVGGICGALLTNLAGVFSGIFIPVDLIDGVFKTITNMLPFYHSVEAIRIILNGSYGEALPHLAVVIGYSAVFFLIAIVAFQRKMSGDRI